MTHCDWAGCHQPTHGTANGWHLCKAHLWEHKRVIASDVHAATECGPHGTPTPPAPSEWLWIRYSGDLHPSGSFLAILAVLNRRPPREQIAS